VNRHGQPAAPKIRASEQSMSDYDSRVGNHLGSPLMLQRRGSGDSSFRAHGGRPVLSATGAFAQSPAERGSYLVNSLMTCHHCHTSIGPNGPQFDRALSGGLRFNGAAFDVIAANITPDPETGIGAWSADEIKKVLVTGVRPNGAPLARRIDGRPAGCLSAAREVGAALVAGRLTCVAAGAHKGCPYGLSDIRLQRRPNPQPRARSMKLRNIT
jgi:hypothetical protein